MIWLEGLEKSWKIIYNKKMSLKPRLYKKPFCSPVTFTSQSRTLNLVIKLDTKQEHNDVFLL